MVNKAVRRSAVVSVDHRRRNIDMTEQLFHESQSGSVLETYHDAKRSLGEFVKNQSDFSGR